MAADAELRYLCGENKGGISLTIVEMKERVEILELQSVFIMRLVLVINDISVS